jgi:hypothetical protein
MINLSHYPTPANRRGFLLRTQKRESHMVQRCKARKANAAATGGPIEPGSPLYRALEMIAQAIAKSLDENSPAKGRRRAKANS